MIKNTDSWPEVLPPELKGVSPEKLDVFLAPIERIPDAATRLRKRVQILELLARDRKAKEEAYRAAAFPARRTTTMEAFPEPDAKTLAQLEEHRKRLQDRGVAQEQIEKSLARLRRMLLIVQRDERCGR